MTDDWLADHNRAAERLERIIKDRMAHAMEASGLLQKQVGQALNWDETKVSRTLGMSRTSRLPTAADVRAWAEVTGEPDDSRDETLKLLSDLRASKKTWKDQLRAEGRDSVQDQYLALYARTSRFRIFQTAVIPGVLQIAPYIRQIFLDLDAAVPGAVDDVESAVRKRLNRSEHLHDMTKEYQILMTEAALRTAVADPPVMVAQLDRLISVAALPNVTKFGIVPQMRRVHTIPQAGFVLYDDLAILETPVNQQPFRGDDAKTLAETFDRHWADAVVDDEARELIRTVMNEFAAV